MIFIENDFKTIQLAAYFVTLDQKETRIYRHLLSKILPSATDRLPTKTLMFEHLEELYGAYFKSRVQSIGQYSVLSIVLTIPDPKIVSDVNLFYDAVNLFDDVINAHTHFKAEVFNEEKRNFLESWSTIKDKKRLYASIRFNAHFYHNDLQGYPITGKPEDIKLLEIADFENYYNDKLKNDDLLYIFNGHFSDLEKDILNQKFNSSFNLKEDVIMDFRKARHATKTLMEKADMSQAQVRIGYILNIYRKDKLYYAALLLDLIIGAYADSKLFKHIRETLGLCYDISSSYDAYKGTLSISAGVDKLKKDEAIAEIIKVIDEIITIGVNEIDLEQAKTYLIHQTKSSLDSQSVLTSRAFIRHLIKEVQTLENRIDRIQSVTLNDMDELLKHLKIDTIYALHGGALDGE
jgi:predicted Zn-dependent peptidase